MVKTIPEIWRGEGVEIHKNPSFYLRSRHKRSIISDNLSQTLYHSVSETATAPVTGSTSVRGWLRGRYKLLAFVLRPFSIHSRTYKNIVVKTAIITWSVRPGTSFSQSVQSFGKTKTPFYRFTLVSKTIQIQNQTSRRRES